MIDHAEAERILYQSFIDPNDRAQLREYIAGLERALADAKAENERLLEKLTTGTVARLYDASDKAQVRGYKVTTRNERGLVMDYYCKAFSAKDAAEQIEAEIADNYPKPWVTKVTPEYETTAALAAKDAV